MKNRLFITENFKKLIKEELLPIGTKQGIVNDFIEYVKNELELPDTPKINVIHDKNNMSDELRSFATYNLSTHEITVNAHNRNLADVLRSLAHELIHYKQNQNGELSTESGITGSDIENEANALAGILMRNYGKINGKIYE